MNHRFDINLEMVTFCKLLTLLCDDKRKLPVAGQVYIDRILAHDNKAYLIIIQMIFIYNYNSYI